jgi:hypothetical protein
MGNEGCARFDLIQASWGAVNLFLHWQKCPHFCHNSNVVQQGLCCCLWSSGACFGAMSLLATSLVIPHALDLLKFYPGESSTILSTVAKNKGNSHKKKAAI